jgi:hypothetical protein
MSWFFKVLTAVVLGLVLCSASEAGRGGQRASGQRGGRHYSGQRGYHGQRSVRRSYRRAYRYYGRFSRRHWDRHFGRWAYFSPAYSSWYYWSPVSAAWVGCDVDDSASDDTEDYYPYDGE